MCHSADTIQFRSLDDALVKLLLNISIDISTKKNKTAVSPIFDGRLPAEDSHSLLLTGHKASLMGSYDVDVSTDDVKTNSGP